MFLFFEQRFNSSDENTTNREDYLKIILGESTSVPEQPFIRIKCPRMPQLGVKQRGSQSLQYLQALKGYLQDKSADKVCFEESLINAIRAAKEVIENGGSIPKIVFGILIDIIDGFKERDISVLVYQDAEGMSALHHLIMFGDECCPVIETLCSIKSELLQVPDSTGQFPLGLAADKNACDIFMRLARDYEHPVKAYVQSLMPTFRAKFQDKNAAEINEFVVQNGTPDTVSIPYLVSACRAWQEAYGNLRAFGLVNTDQLLQIFEKAPKGFFSGKIEKVVSEHIAKLKRENFQEETDIKGNTKLHIAYLHEAHIAATAILMKLAEQKDKRPENRIEPTKIIEWALKLKNKAGITPPELSDSKSFPKAIEKKSAQIIKKDCNSSNRLRP